MPLNGKQRAYLRRLGQEQEPIVMIGKAGLTATLRVQLEDALQARELVKCRALPNAPGAPADLASALAADSKAEVIGVIGRNFVLFRRSAEKPRIDLPN